MSVLLQAPKRQKKAGATAESKGGEPEAGGEEEHELAAAPAPAPAPAAAVDDLDEIPPKLQWPTNLPYLHKIIKSGANLGTLCFLISHDPSKVLLTV